MRPMGALVNTNIEKAVAVIGMFENVKTHGVPGNVADKDKTGAIENLFAIDLNGHWGKPVSPESAPEGPEVIEVIYVSGAILADLGNDLAVKTEPGYRGETPAVGVAQIEGPRKTRFEGSYQRRERFFKTQLVGEEIFGAAGDDKEWLIAAFEAVCDFPDSAVAAHGNNHCAVGVTGGICGKFAGVFERAGKIHTNVKAPASEVLLKSPAGEFLAAAGARFGIDYVCDITVVGFNCAHNNNR
jgi:hypothetical protein